MKDILNSILGILILGFLVFGIVRSVYKRNFAEPEFTIIKSEKTTTPITNALFWYELEIEKTASGMINAKLANEENDFIKPLYDTLYNAGMTNHFIKTMSKKATKAMIELDAYRGEEPNVWQIANQNGHKFIFKVMMTNVKVSNRRIRNDIKSIVYQYSLYDATNRRLIWQAEATRLANFYGGMPDGNESISYLRNQLKKSNL